MKPRGLLGYVDDRGLSYSSGLEVCLVYHTMRLVPGRWFVVCGAVDVCWSRGRQAYLRRCLGIPIVQFEQHLGKDLWRFWGQEAGDQCRFLGPAARESLNRSWKFVNINIEINRTEILDMFIGMPSRFCSLCLRLRCTDQLLYEFRAN